MVITIVVIVALQLAAIPPPSVKPAMPRIRLIIEHTHTSWRRTFVRQSPRGCESAGACRIARGAWENGNGAEEPVHGEGVGDAEEVLQGEDGLRVEGGMRARAAARAAAHAGKGHGVWDEANLAGEMDKIDGGARGIWTMQWNGRGLRVGPNIGGCPVGARLDVESLCRKSWRWISAVVEASSDMEYEMAISWEHRTTGDGDASRWIWRGEERSINLKNQSES